jgi:ABC-type Fe3+-hydroxamate transport system substrate-binding protein
MHGLEMFDVKHTDTHGGAIMVFASHSPLKFPIGNNVKKLLNKEKVMGLDKLSTYKKFAERPPMIRQKLVKMLKEIRKNKKRIVGYGASAKCTTLLQYCGINRKLIDYITDSAPSKQGKYTPGTHIPIVSPDKLKLDKPDVIVIFAWNYAENIMEKEKWFKDTGGKFIIPIPEPVVI